MKKHYPLTALLLVISFFMFHATVTAQALYQVSLDEQVQKSTVIVEGEVTQQTSFWNPDKTMIFTANKIKVFKVFKGSLVPAFIEVITVGGSIGDMAMGATEMLTLDKKNIGVFFCYPTPSNLSTRDNNGILYDVYSSSQGFFSYDLLKQTASNPFVKYQNIETDLYSILQAKTNRAYEDKNPSFKVSAYAQHSNQLAPGITSFSPATVNAGKLADVATNTITITGTGFGNTPNGLGGINFDDANNGTGGTPYFVPDTSSLVQSWTNTQIIVKVPSRAGTGSFTVLDNITGAPSSASATLTVNYSILNLTFANPAAEKMFSLMNINGSGGYNFVYSTGTAGSGIDFSTSAQRNPFERAIATWKETAGLNYSFNGNTTSQLIAPGNGTNIIMLDNTTNPSLGVLPAGVLASCYYSGASCTGNLYSLSPGFDIVIRSAGVSTGSNSFNNGPCATSTAITEIDMESVLLHELGHSLGLGHINDSYIGPWPNVDPGKLMNYAIVNGVDRRSPDWSAFTGALYCINPRGLNYGGCTAITEMIPLARTNEAKDECPVTFPSTAITTGTAVAFDLNHATSNKTVDPQYNDINCTATGTGITNNAYYAIKSGAAGSMIVTVSGYTTTPAAQAACSGAGVELAMYQTSSCPTAQAFPVPVACRTFNADGALTAFTLAANTNYLIMVDGISNTKANFTLTFTGAALPLKVINFVGSATALSNNLSWTLGEITSVDKIALEASTDGASYNEIYTQSIITGVNSLSNTYADKTVAAKTYYRLKIYDKSGTITYSNIILLKKNSRPTEVTITPNPAKDQVTVSFYKNKAGKTNFNLLDMAGKVVAKESYQLVAGGQSLLSNITRSVPKGVYMLQVDDGENVTSNKIIVE